MLVLGCLQADTDEGQAACDKLGVDVLPTVQFWRSKKKLWEHRGILHLEQDLGEGKAPSVLCALCSGFRLGFRGKKKLWEHQGILHLEQDLGEGAAFCPLCSG